MSLAKTFSSHFSPCSYWHSSAFCAAQSLLLLNSTTIHFNMQPCLALPFIPLTLSSTTLNATRLTSSVYRNPYNVPLLTRFIRKSIQTHTKLCELQTSQSSVPPPQDPLRSASKLPPPLPCRESLTTSLKFSAAGPLEHTSLISRPIWTCAPFCLKFSQVLHTPTYEMTVPPLLTIPHSSSHHPSSFIPSFLHPLPDLSILAYLIPPSWPLIHPSLLEHAMVLPILKTYLSLCGLS